MVPLSVHVPRQLMMTAISETDMLHRIELTSLGNLLRGDFLRLDFSPASASKCSLQFIVIHKIRIEITNTRNNWLNVYFHLVANGDDVRVFGDPSCLAPFFGLM